MEFKTYLQIIKKYRKIFLAIWSIIVLLPLFSLFVQPIIYEGEQTILIIRDGNDNKETKIANKSDDYDYFYRLEADSKLGKLLVSFLNDKELLNNSFDNNFSQEGDLEKIAISKEEKKWMIKNIHSKILSGGYIKLVINGHNKELVQKVGDRIFKQLEKKIAKVGDDSNKKIKLENSAIIINEKNKLYLPVTLGTFFGGLLVAIFTVLGIYYWRDDEQDGK